jgi:hypothetical protein
LLSKKENQTVLLDAVNNRDYCSKQYDKIEKANFTAGKILGIDNNEMLGRNIMNQV